VEQCHHSKTQSCHERHSHQFVTVNLLKQLIQSSQLLNGRAHIRHQRRITAALSCHRFLINSGVEKINNI
jgi:hypothetical protein